MRMLQHRRLGTYAAVPRVSAHQSRSQPGRVSSYVSLRFLVAAKHSSALYWLLRVTSTHYSDYFWHRVCATHPQLYTLRATYPPLKVVMYPREVLCIFNKSESDPGRIIIAAPTPESIHSCAPLWCTVAGKASFCAICRSTLTCNIPNKKSKMLLS